MCPTNESSEIFQELAAVVKQRINSRGRDVLMQLWAVALVLRTSKDEIRTVMKRVPGGYRMVMSALGLIERAAVQVTETIPDKQVTQVRDQMRHSELRIDTRVKAAELSADNWIISNDDLAWLINAAGQAMCILCEDKGRSCELRRIARESPVRMSNAITMCDIDGE